MVEHDLRCSSKHICCSTHLTPPPPPPLATHNPPSTLNTKKKKQSMVSTKQNPNPQQTKPIPTTSKPTTNQQRANDEQNTCKRWANWKPLTQIATTETQDQHTETHIANRKSQPNYHPNRLATTIETQIATHWPKSQPTGQNLNLLHPNHKTHHWSTTLQSTAKKSRERESKKE